MAIKTKLFMGMTLLFLITMIVTSYSFYTQYHALKAINSSELLDLIIFNSMLPQVIMALLVGGALSLSSILLQQITHNPLASDSTLSVNSGAYLSLLLVTLFAPTFFQWIDASIIALIGALLALSVVFLLSYRHQFSATRLLMAGLILNLYLGSMAAILIIFNPESSQSLFQWEAGSLIQDNWIDVYKLALVTAFCLLLFSLLARSLNVMQLSDAQSLSLGVSLKSVRALTLLCVCYLCAMSISLVGMIGFIGLASATITRQLSIQSLKWRVLISYFIGALLLLLTDQALILIQQKTQIHLPVGVATAFIGAPLLLYLIFKVLPNRVQTSLSTSLSQPKIRTFKKAPFFLLILIFMALLIACFTISNSADGFYLTDLNTLSIELKLPRLLTALCSGAMLGLCGMVLQRLTNNPMASPELLGISSGSAAFVILAFLFFNIDYDLLWLFAFVGAILTFLMIAIINYRHHFQPDKVILSGVAISTLLAALLRLFLSNGDPRAQYLLVWLSGSTYASELNTTLIYGAIGLLCFLLLFLCHRVLTLLLLPSSINISLGLNLARARFGLIVLTTLLITLATLQIGPLSFIGLLAPLLARLMGFSETRIQMLASVLLGSGLMLISDWIGRNLLFPYEIPAGLVASLIGGSCFLILMRKL